MTAKGPVMLFGPAGSAPRWVPHLNRAMPELEVRVWPDMGDPADIGIAMFWNPPQGMLAGLRNLRLIISLGAGVEHMLGDPSLPRHVPLVRLVDPYMTQTMAEYVLWQVMCLHRHDIDYRAQQRLKEWRYHEQVNAADRRVGILGLGDLGMASARLLNQVGFDVAGWSRRPKSASDIACLSGKDGLEELLARSEILVCLLPLTPETTGILNASLFAHMPRGAMIVNCGRGGHLAEGDLLDALDSGQLSGAALDVFQIEPLPSEHPFWVHPRIIVTPHVAAQSNPPTGAKIVTDNIRRLLSGEPLHDLVDYATGY